MAWRLVKKEDDDHKQNYPHQNDNYSNQNENYRDKRGGDRNPYLVGVSKPLMDRLQKCGFDQNQLTNEQLLELRFKNWHTCYIEGIPLNKFTKTDISKAFNVSPSDIRFKPLPRNSDRYDVVYGCCYIHYDDENRCKKLVNEINSNRMMYANGWKIRANYGLLKYCKFWLYDHCESPGSHGNMLHGIYCNFDAAQIHTKELEQKLKNISCGYQKEAHHSDEEDYKAETEVDMASERYSNSLYDICEEKFIFWLCDIVRLKQYLPLFKKHQWNDISMVEFIDQEVMTNELRITNKIHIGCLLRKIEEFRYVRHEFELFLNKNPVLKEFKQSLCRNGIMTINDLNKEVKTNADVIRTFKTSDKQKTQKILSAIYGYQEMY